MENCIFCDIVNKKVEASIIYEDHLVCCFLDIEPINPGHVLIIPKNHTLDLDEMDDVTLTRIMKITKVLVKVMKQMFQPDGYSIMQNGGEFNEIGHFHLHIFPRYKNDGFSWVFNENARNSNFHEIKENFIKELKLMV